MLLKYRALYEAANHFRDYAFQRDTRNLILTFQPPDDDGASEHDTILEMVALLKEFEIISK